jgi:REP element-mobilizing transposase RayT
MSHTRIWIHAVWATKKHQPFLTKSIREDIFFHIKENARKNGIEINFINGFIDHVHCLIKLTGEQSVSRVIQMLKGESSRWINLNRMTKNKFEWADQYFAGSVSESGKRKVREYIRNQERHHAKRSFDQEYDDFLERYGLKPIGSGEVDPLPTQD